jgi:hypothetical protein
MSISRNDPEVRMFLIHLAKLIPSYRDQKILLSYMAACVQNKGVEFQWKPIIVGTPGNGKTLLTNAFQKL